MDSPSKSPPGLSRGVWIRTSLEVLSEIQNREPLPKLDQSCNFEEKTHNFHRGPDLSSLGLCDHLSRFRVESWPTAIRDGSGLDTGHWKENIAVLRANRIENDNAFAPCRLY